MQFVLASPPVQADSECTCLRSFPRYLPAVTHSPMLLYSCSVCTKKANRHFIVPAKDFKLIQVHTFVGVVLLSLHATGYVLVYVPCSPGHSGYVACQSRL